MPRGNANKSITLHFNYRKVSSITSDIVSSRTKVWFPLSHTDSRSLVQVSVQTSFLACCDGPTQGLEIMRVSFNYSIIRLQMYYSHLKYSLGLKSRIITVVSCMMVEKTRLRLLNHDDACFSLVYSEVRLNRLEQ